MGIIQINTNQANHQENMHIINFLFLAGATTCSALPSRRNRDYSRRKRITNGTELARFDGAPFFAQIIWQHNQPDQSDMYRRTRSCGAAWISGTDLLTAAHCTAPRHTDGYNLLIIPHKDGVGDEKNFKGFGRVQYRYQSSRDVSQVIGELEPWQIIPGRSSRIIVHPDYDTHGHMSTGGDIAIIRTTRPTNWKFPIQIATPEEANELSSRSYFIFYGLGAATDSGAYPFALEQSNPVQFFQCTDLRHTQPSAPYINPTAHICNYPQMGSNACFGDSGGPSVMNHKLYGLTSFGPPPCSTSVNVATNVAAYTSWILQNSNYDSKGVFYDDELRLKNLKMLKKMEQDRLRELLVMSNRRRHVD